MRNLLLGLWGCVAVAALSVGCEYHDDFCEEEDFEDGEHDPRCCHHHDHGSGGRGTGTGGRGAGGGGNGTGGGSGGTSGGSGGAAQSGGAPTSGGASSTGGAANSGGTPASGGTASSGGAPATGGAASSGGTPASGGASSTGGAPQPTPCEDESDCEPGTNCDLDEGVCKPSDAETCGELTTAASCANRNDCTPIYAGTHCSCGPDCECQGGEPGCICQSFEFFRCNPVE